MQAFDRHLADQRDVGVDAASVEDIQKYAASLSQSVIKARMRALALYYKFSGNILLAKLASAIREKETARTRKVFKLRDFQGVSQEEEAKLEAVGIVDVEQILAAGKTETNRQRLAEQAGIPTEVILELVKLSGLSRLGAVKSVRARLYYEAGLDTPDKFRQWEPEALREMLVEFVECSGFEGIAPLPKELRNAIETARKLPDIVEY